jgi:hypothetical protein
VLNLSYKKEQKDLIDIITFGLFIIIIGVFFLITPDLLNKILFFFKDLELRKYSTFIYLPYPKSEHAILFNALYNFSLFFAVIHIPILAARFILKDPVDKKGDTFSGLIFWFGASYILNSLLEENIGWIEFTGYLILLIGITLVVSNSIKLSAYISRGRKY